MEALDRYRAEVSRLPACTSEQFTDWLGQYRAGDEDAGRAITGSYLGMALTLVESLPELPPGLDLLDTVQEANAGLVAALRTFPGTTPEEFADHARRTINSWLSTLDIQEG